MTRLHLSLAEFEALPVYVNANPVGAWHGKRWRRLRRWGLGDDCPRWWIGEFREVKLDPPLIVVRWYRPVIRVPARSAPLTDSHALRRTA